MKRYLIFIIIMAFLTSGSLQSQDLYGTQYVGYQVLKSSHEESVQTLEQLRAQLQELPGAQAFASERIQNLLTESNQTLGGLRAHYPDSNVMTWTESDRELYFRAKAVKAAMLFAPDFYTDYNIVVERTSMRKIRATRFTNPDEVHYTNIGDGRGLQPISNAEYIDMATDEPFYRVLFYAAPGEHLWSYQAFEYPGIVIIVEFEEAGQFRRFNLLRFSGAAGLGIFSFENKDFAWLDRKYEQWMNEYQMVFSDYKIQENADRTERFIRTLEETMERFLKEEQERRDRGEPYRHRRILFGS